MEENFSSPTLPILHERARRAAEIAGRPQRYKICEGCESIVSRRAATCPSCAAYRFNTGRRAIVDHARLLGSREQTGVATDDLR